MPNENDTDSLIWHGINKKPLSNNEDEMDLWMLDMACIQLRVNQHDWRHRKSCFKNGRTTCRYGIPLAPTDVTEVKAIYAEKDHDVGDIEFAKRKTRPPPHFPHLTLWTRPHIT